MEYEQVRQSVIACVAKQLSKDSSLIRDEATLDSLGADSVDRVEIVMHLEEELEIEINDAEADTLNTIGQLIEYCYQRVTQKIAPRA